MQSKLKDPRRCPDAGAAQTSSSQMSLEVQASEHCPDYEAPDAFKMTCSHMQLKPQDSRRRLDYKIPNADHVLDDDKTDYITAAQHLGREPRAQKPAATHG